MDIPFNMIWYNPALLLMKYFMEKIRTFLLKVCGKTGEKSIMVSQGIQFMLYVSPRDNDFAHKVRMIWFFHWIQDDQQTQIRWWQWFCQLLWIQFSSDVIFSDLWINSGWACYNRKGSKTRAINSTLWEKQRKSTHFQICGRDSTRNVLCLLLSL